MKACVPTHRLTLTQSLDQVERKEAIGQNMRFTHSKPYTALKVNNHCGKMVAYFDSLHFMVLVHQCILQTIGDLMFSLYNIAISMRRSLIKTYLDCILTNPGRTEVNTVRFLKENSN